MFTIMSCGTICSAYDRAAIKFRGIEADINFSLEDYEEDLKQVERERESLGFVSCRVSLNGIVVFDTLCVFSKLNFRKSLDSDCE